jgi:predicted RNase H-like HicB family nuclease
MTTVIQAKYITLNELRTKFALQLVEDIQFFPEWQTDLPEITDEDKQHLDRLKRGFFNLVEYPPMLENTVKMAVCAEIPGANGQGRTKEQSLSSLSEAITLILEDRRADALLRELARPAMEQGIDII